MGPSTTRPVERPPGCWDASAAGTARVAQAGPRCQASAQGLGLGLGLLQRPAVARSWSHPGSWDCTVKHQRCVTETQDDAYIS
jgi:hypothetical protein